MTSSKTSAQNMAKICPKPHTVAPKSFNSHWFEMMNERYGSTVFVFCLKTFKLSPLPSRVLDIYPTQVCFLVLLKTLFCTFKVLSVGYSANHENSTSNVYWNKVCSRQEALRNIPFIFKSAKTMVETKAS